MENKEKKVIIALLIIIIFLIIFFILSKRIAVIDVALEMPTGNVDIFDINITEKDNCCNCDAICDENCECNKNKSQETIKDEEKCEGNCIKKVLVYDEDVKYTNITPLNIFSHQSYYIVNGVIAPGSENTYQFIIRNNNDFAIKYSLKIKEENPFNINMLYKLSINGEEIIGKGDRWVTAEELFQKSITLANDSYNVYSLEWKWFESENDTQIGKNIESNYNLNISFFAEKY